METVKVRRGLSVKAPDLSDMLTDEQIANVLSTHRTYRDHPLKGLFLAATGRSTSEQILCNTNRALSCLRFDSENALDDWIHVRMQRAAEVGDFRNAAAALGELRAAGALKQAGFDVIPQREGKTATCDFLVRHGGTKAYIEVATKLMNKGQADKLEAEYSAEKNLARAEAAKDRLVTTESVIHPGGSPKPAETVGENVGHKFASIKHKSKQAVPSAVSLMWVDVQDEDWWPANELYARPVISWNREFSSGGIWHGFYGKKGIPTFERQSVEIRAIEPQYRQTYPGLFSQTTRWSAALLSFRRSTLIFEHPSPDVPMPSELIQCLLALPWLQYENCWMNWPSKSRETLAARIDRTIQELEELSAKARFTW